MGALKLVPGPLRSCCRDHEADRILVGVGAAADPRLMAIQARPRLPNPTSRSLRGYLVGLIPYGVIRLCVVAIRSADVCPRRRDVVISRRASL